MTIVALLRGLAEAGRLMVGVPSYQAYLAHRQAQHPDEPVMSETAFFRNRQEARYAGRNAGKCC